MLILFDDVTVDAASYGVRGFKWASNMFNYI